MKKISLLLITVFLFIISGCQDPIFEAVREDVEPEEATVSGNITSITRYTAGGTEYLVLAADGGLRYKNKDSNHHDAWHSYGVSFSLHSYDFDSSSHTGRQILTVLADSTTLYLITAEYSHTTTEGLSYPSDIELWAKNVTGNGKRFLKGENWTKIDTEIDLFPTHVDSTTKFYKSDFNVFQTNAPIQAHRAAFICSHKSDGYHYYRLNGLSEPVEFTISELIDPSNSSSPHARSAAYFNGEIRFFTAPAATTNETYDSEATYCYYTNGDTRLYYTDGDFIFDEAHYTTGGIYHKISALATTADSILIGYGNPSNGGSGGIDRVKLFSGKPNDSTSSFKTNAKFQITDSYMVLTLLNATPEKNETDSSLYASITFAGTNYNFESVGLWSYYPNRGNWNRE